MVSPDEGSHDTPPFAPASHTWWSPPRSRVLTPSPTFVTGERVGKQEPEQRHTCGFYVRDSPVRSSDYETFISRWRMPATGGGGGTQLTPGSGGEYGGGRETGLERRSSSSASLSGRHRAQSTPDGRRKPFSSAVLERHCLVLASRGSLQQQGELTCGHLPLHVVTRRRGESDPGVSPAAGYYQHLSRRSGRSGSFREVFGSSMEEMVAEYEATACRYRGGRSGRSRRSRRRAGVPTAQRHMGGSGVGGRRSASPSWTSAASPIPSSDHPRGGAFLPTPAGHHLSHQLTHSSADMTTRRERE
jgi:hypothetical protein